MQPFGGEGYTDSQVKAALQAPNRYQIFNYQLLKPLTSPYLHWVDGGSVKKSVRSCTVKWDRTAKVNRTAKFEITDGVGDVPTINYMADAIRVFWSVAMTPGAIGNDPANGGFRTWCLGTFFLVAPDIPYRSDRRVYSGATLYPSLRKVDGYDAMQLLTERKLRTWVSRAAGENAVGTVVNILQQEFPTDPSWDMLTINIPPSDVTLDKAKVYAVGTQYIDEIDDLLAFAKYGGIWADVFGSFQARPYVRPSQRPVEFFYRDDDVLGDPVIVRDSVAETLDGFDAPNRFVRYVSNSDPAKTMTSDTIDLTDPNNWLSIPARGGRVIADIQPADAKTLADLNQKVRDDAEEAQLRHGQMKWSVPLMPHDHEDVVGLHHSRLPAGDQDKVWIGRSWAFDCTADGTVDLVMEKVGEAVV